MFSVIMIVNGGVDPVQGRWMDLGLGQIDKHTGGQEHKLLVWDNNNDEQLRELMAERGSCEYFAAASYEHLSHKHAIPLQRLYARARELKADYVITMDSDAFPVRDDWLELLTGAIDGQCVLSGVWRDELRASIPPYIHPSCLCTTPGYVERYDLRFDYIPPVTGQRHDTLSEFTRVAADHGLPVFPLYRSNVNEWHRLMGGLYGDVIYHHGAGSRNRIIFHGEKKSAERSAYYAVERDRASSWLFEDPEAYVAWLRGAGDWPADLDWRPDGGGIKAASRGGRMRTLLPVKRGSTGEVDAGMATRIARKAIQRLVRSRNRRKRRVFAEVPREMQSPFSVSDLAPLAPGWSTGPPDFVGVGAPKCGTSWLYSLLLQHPQIVSNRFLDDAHRPNKETFCLIYEEAANEATLREVYPQAFARPDGALCGEFSTVYLHYPGVIERLRKAAPDCQVIVMLRNPLDRMLSGLNHLYRSRGRALGIHDNERLLAFSMAFSWRLEAYHFSLYSRAVENLLHWFDRDRVHVLLYEELVADPHQQLTELFAKFGLGTRWAISDYESPVNRTAHRISAFTPDERACLAREFKHDVVALKRLLPELDVTLWSDFADVVET